EEVKSALSQGGNKLFLRVHSDQFSGQAVLFQHRLQQLRVIRIVFQVENPQRQLHKSETKVMQGMRVANPFGDCMFSGDGSLATPLKATTCRTAFRLCLPRPFPDFPSNTAGERASNSAVRAQKASAARRRSFWV